MLLVEHLVAMLYTFDNKKNIIFGTGVHKSKLLTLDGCLSSRTWWSFVIFDQCVSLCIKSRMRKIHLGLHALFLQMNCH